MTGCGDEIRAHGQCELEQDDPEVSGWKSTWQCTH